MFFMVEKCIRVGIFLSIHQVAKVYKLYIKDYKNQHILSFSMERISINGQVGKITYR